MKIERPKRKEVQVAGQDQVYGARLFWTWQPPAVSKSAACQCGGGRFLGKLHSIPMYENHNSDCCDFYLEKECSTFLKNDYFKILQNFEITTNETTYMNYNDRVINLLHAWEECKDIISGDCCIEISGVHVLMYYAASDSALLILDPAWKDADEQIKFGISSILRNIEFTLKVKKSNKNAIKTCNLLLSLIKNPWSHNILPKILHGNASHNEVANFIQFENSNIYALRLRILCQMKCETEVLKLSSMALNMYNFESKNKQYFEERDFEFIRDIYYACLVCCNKKAELINLLMEYSHNDAKILLESYCYKIKGLSQLPQKNRPRICKSVIVVTEMASCTFVIKSLSNLNFFDDFSILLKSWSILITSLMKSNLEFNLNGLCLKDVIYKFVNMAPTARHLYMICDVVNDEFGINLPGSMLIYIYIKALSTNINEKKLCQYLRDDAGLFDSLKMLVQGYLKLANQFDNILSVNQECILTAYSLMPSSELFAKIENLAMNNEKLVKEHLINIPENSSNKYNKGSNMDIKSIISNKRCLRHTSKSCKYNPNSNYVHNEISYLKIYNDLSNLPDPLSPIAIDDFIAVIKHPRCFGLNWDLEWSKLKINCKQYLEPMDTNMINRNQLERPNYTHHKMDTEELGKRQDIEMKNLTNDTDHCISVDKKPTRLSISRKRKMVSSTQKPVNKKKVSPIQMQKGKSKSETDKDEMEPTTYLPRLRSSCLKKNITRNNTLFINRWVIN